MSNNCNSIYEYMTAEDLYAEIKMELQVGKKYFLVMEGSSDILRFARFFKEKIVSYVNSYGKTNLLSLNAIIDRKVRKNVVLFCDRDFDEVEQVIHSEEIIWSEHYDFDFDLACSDFFIRYFDEMFDREKCRRWVNEKEVLFEIVKRIEEVSIFKYINHKLQLSMPVSSVEWADYFDGAKLEIGKYVVKVLKKFHGRDPTKAEIEAIIANIRKYKEEGLDLLHITNGHDLFVAVGVCLMSEFGSKKRQQVFGSEIERHFRMALNDREFRKMKIYDSIMNREFGDEIIAV